MIVKDNVPNAIHLTFIDQSSKHHDVLRHPNHLPSDWVSVRHAAGYRMDGAV
jgi:hypothetical protein